MLFYQVGELFQSYAVGRSRRNITQLMDIRPDYANIEVDGTLERVDPSDVEVGSVIVVQPGEKVPVDGVVIEGSSSLDTSALTGESLPREVGQGDELISGCINISGVLRVRTTKEFGESTVSKILDLVENASSRKSKSEDFISKFARIYTPAVCIGALLLAVLPPVASLVMGGAGMSGSTGRSRSWSSAAHVHWSYPYRFRSSPASEAPARPGSWSRVRTTSRRSRRRGPSSSTRPERLRAGSSRSTESITTRWRMKGYWSLPPMPRSSGGLRKRQAHAHSGR